MNIDLDKYENSVIQNLDKENIKKIVEFLIDKKCDYIEEILNNYLDIFTFDYDEFIIKFNKLNKKYHGNLINEIQNDTNIIEELYTIDEE